MRMGISYKYAYESKKNWSLILVFIDYFKFALILN